MVMLQFMIQWCEWLRIFLCISLVRGQGNFGSMDGDGAAAMRYTEAKLAAVSEELLFDIEKDTVDFNPNYDDSQKEPQVLPAKLPNFFKWRNGNCGGNVN